MFFLIKVVKPLFLPPTLIALGMLVSLFFLFRRKRRSGFFILLCVFIVYYFISLEPVSYFLTASLESRTTSLIANTANDVTAIVVLAGGAERQEGHRPFPELSGTSWKRLWHGIELYRLYEGKIPIFYTGGSGDPFNSSSVEAELARQYALSLGIPEDRFLIEQESRDTFENARAVQEFLDKQITSAEEQKIILVTSARHMPRALAVMRKKNINVIPAATDFTTGSLRWSLFSFLPSHASFSSSVLSIHEWVGLMGYRILGRI